MTVNSAVGSGAVRGGCPDLMLDKREFAAFREPLRSAMAEVASTRFDCESDYQTIRGWMKPRERQMLYAMARCLPGPIVEIGSWQGLSTTAIARGIRDSGSAKRFDAIDLNLTPENFRPVNGGIGIFLPGDSLPHGVCSEELYRRDIVPFVSAPGGPHRLLLANLERLGLSKYVSVHVGDFRDWPARVCNWLFCDVLHDLHEIEVNAPHLRKFLQPGSLLASHDVGGKPDLIAALRAKLPLGHAVTVNSLYVAEVI